MVVERIVSNQGNSNALIKTLTIAEGPTLRPEKADRTQSPKRNERCGKVSNFPEKMLNGHDESVHTSRSRF